MTVFVRIVNDVVVDITDDPQAKYHPSIAAEFISATDDVKLGWVLDDVNLAAPTVAAEVAPTRRTLVSRTEYYGLFTPTEEAMIRLTASEQVTPALIASADDTEKSRLMMVASLAVMLRRTDALGPEGTIDLGAAQVIGGLDLLVAAGLLTQARKDKILTGVTA